MWLYFKLLERLNDRVPVLPVVKRLVWFCFKLLERLKLNQFCVCSGLSGRASHDPSRRAAGGAGGGCPRRRATANVPLALAVPVAPGGGPRARTASASGRLLTEMRTGITCLHFSYYPQADSIRTVTTGRARAGLGASSLAGSGCHWQFAFLCWCNG
jgi:hypothetical protein